MLRRGRAFTGVGGAGAILTAAILALVTGCATYSDRLLAARRTVAAGDIAAAVTALDALLGVGTAGELPAAWDSDQALLVLERGILQQALGRYAASATDLQAADGQLEVLDIADDTVGTIGAYVYSDTATKYRSSPTEKLSLNAFNILNYLVQHDLAGARVEAKRFSVMRDYLRDFDPEHAHGAFGSYVAGFVFEQLGEYSAAMHHYDDAIRERSFDTLRGPVAWLAERTSYHGPAVEQLLGTEASADAGAAAGEEPSAQLLVVASIGRVPYKVPRRMPIGAAVGYAGAWLTGDLRLLEYGAAKFIVYPELIEPISTYRTAELWIDGSRARMERASDLGAEILREHAAMKPRIFAAAVSRMLVRAGIAEGARTATRAGARDMGRRVRRVLGLLAALLTEGALTAADRPDTRSWQSLPRWIYVYRTFVSPGRHAVTVALQGSQRAERRFSVEVDRASYAAVVVTAPR